MKNIYFFYIFNRFQQFFENQKIKSEIRDITTRVLSHAISIFSLLAWPGSLHTTMVVKKNGSLFLRSCKFLIAVVVLLLGDGGHVGVQVGQAYILPPAFSSLVSQF